MGLANEADKDCDFANNISGCFHFVKKKLTSVPKIEMIDYTPPPLPRTPPARTPLAARRSSARSPRAHVCTPFAFSARRSSHAINMVLAQTRWWVNAINLKDRARGYCFAAAIPQQLRPMILFSEVLTRFGIALVSLFILSALTSKLGN